MSGIVVFQTAFVGDVVLTTPLLREVRRRCPERRLTLVGSPGAAKLLAGAPWLDEIVPFDKRRGDRGARGIARIVRRIRQGPVETVLAAQRSSRTGLLAMLSGARERVGFAGASGSWAYSVRVPWQEERHCVRRYLELAAPLGVDASGVDARPEVPVSPEAAEAVEQVLRSEGIGPRDAVLTMSPGSVWPTKCWTREGYAGVVRWASGAGLRPVLVGSPDEEPLCRAISDLAGGGHPVLAGRSTLPELAALLARSRAVVGNDSGASHIAAAVGTPVVAVFGPTSSTAGYSPYGPGVRIVEHRSLECRPCHRHGPPVCPLGHFRCMREIEASAVIAELEALLGDDPAG
jgi:heptosyltransferase-2